MDPVLPPLLLGGHPKSLHSMKVSELRAFMPLMLKAAHFARAERAQFNFASHPRPPWWSADVLWSIDYINGVDSKDRAALLRDLITSCYGYYRQAGTLHLFDSLPGEGVLWTLEEVGKEYILVDKRQQRPVCRFSSSYQIHPLLALKARIESGASKRNIVAPTQVTRRTGQLLSTASSVAEKRGYKRILDNILRKPSGIMWESQVPKISIIRNEHVPVKCSNCEKCVELPQTTSTLFDAVLNHCLSCANATPNHRRSTRKAESKDLFMQSFGLYPRAAMGAAITTTNNISDAVGFNVTVNDHSAACQIPCTSTLGQRIYSSGSSVQDVSSQYSASSSEPISKYHNKQSRRRGRSRTRTKLVTPAKVSTPSLQPLAFERHCNPSCLSMLQPVSYPEPRKFKRVARSLINVSLSREDIYRKMHLEEMSGVIRQFSTSHPSGNLAKQCNLESRALTKKLSERLLQRKAAAKGTHSLRSQKQRVLKGRKKLTTTRDERKQKSSVGSSSLPHATSTVKAKAHATRSSNRMRTRGSYRAEKHTSRYAAVLDSVRRKRRQTELLRKRKAVPISRPTKTAAVKSKRVSKKGNQNELAISSSVTHATVEEEDRISDRDVSPSGSVDVCLDEAADDDDDLDGLIFDTIVSIEDVIRLATPDLQDCTYDWNLDRLSDAEDTDEDYTYEYNWDVGKFSDNAELEDQGMTEVLTEVQGVAKRKRKRKYNGGRVVVDNDECGSSPGRQRSRKQCLTKLEPLVQSPPPKSLMRPVQHGRKKVPFILSQGNSLRRVNRPVVVVKFNNKSEPTGQAAGEILLPTRGGPPERKQPTETPLHLRKRTDYNLTPDEMSKCLNDQRFFALAFEKQRSTKQERDKNQPVDSAIRQFINDAKSKSCAPSGSEPPSACASPRPSLDQPRCRSAEHHQRQDGRIGCNGAWTMDASTSTEDVPGFVNYITSDTLQFEPPAEAMNDDADSAGKQLRNHTWLSNRPSRVKNYWGDEFAKKVFDKSSAKRNTSDKPTKSESYTTMHPFIPPSVTISAEDRQKVIIIDAEDKARVADQAKCGAGYNMEQRRWELSAQKKYSVEKNPAQHIGPMRFVGDTRRSAWGSYKVDHVVVHPSVPECKTDGGTFVVKQVTSSGEVKVIQEGSSCGVKNMPKHVGDFEAHGAWVPPQHSTSQLVGGQSQQSMRSTTRPAPNPAGPPPPVSRSVHPRTDISAVGFSTMRTPPPTSSKSITCPDPTGLQPNYPTASTSALPRPSAIPQTGDAASPGKPVSSVPPVPAHIVRPGTEQQPCSAHLLPSVRTEGQPAVNKVRVRWARPVGPTVTPGNASRMVAVVRNNSRKISGVNPRMPYSMPDPKWSIPVGSMGDQIKKYYPEKFNPVTGARMIRTDPSDPHPQPTTRDTRPKTVTDPSTSSAPGIDRSKPKG